MSGRPQLISAFVTARRFLARALMAAALCAVVAADACAADGYVIGDSIGQGLAQAVGLRGVAKPSVNFRRATVLQQLREAPKGATILMSLGINDAMDPVQQLSPHIERVIAAALERGERVVWIGPPCVLKTWDVQAEKLDAHLRARLADTPIQYVSLRHQRLCEASVRTADGEHFKPSGYALLWEQVRGASPWAGEVDHAATAPARAARPGPPRTSPTRTSMVASSSSQAKSQAETSTALLYTAPRPARHEDAQLPRRKTRAPQNSD